MLTITSITIIKNGGADLVLLQTTLPSAVWPYEGSQSLSFQCAHGSGETYCAWHFPGIPVSTVDESC